MITSAAAGYRLPRDGKMPENSLGCLRMGWLDSSRADVSVIAPLARSLGAARRPRICPDHK